MDILKKEIKEGNIELSVPSDPNLGDFALPCYPFAKILKEDPMIIAAELREKINANFIERMEVKGAYLNFFVNKIKLTDRVMKRVLMERDKYGGSNGKERIMVEFSQANTHKAFHVGHIRGTALGESLSRILAFSGNSVIRANYQGDTGMHVAKWIWCYKTFHHYEELKDDGAWIASIYVDAVKRLAEKSSLQQFVDEINRDIGYKKDLQKLWKESRKLSLDSLDRIYKELDTKFDIKFFESEMEKKGKDISMDLVRRGIAEESDGAIIVNLWKHNLGVWVLLRKDKTVLYSAKDLALADEKFNKYKVNRSIYVVGKEQEHYFSQLFKTLELMGNTTSQLRYVPVSLVRLPEGKMSSRTGDNILYSEFKDELVKSARKEVTSRFKLEEDEIEKRSSAIAVAAMKYSMLKQHPNKVIVFNKQEALQFEGDTGPYLLYSYARASSILDRSGKLAKEFSVPKLKEKEIDLVKKIDEFPDRVVQAARELNPGVIANYAYKLAQMFNEFYAACKVLGSDEIEFRVHLVEVFRTTIRNALRLLGIKVIERM